MPGRKLEKPSPARKLFKPDPGLDVDFDDRTSVAYYAQCQVDYILVILHTLAGKMTGLEIKRFVQLQLIPLRRSLEKKINIPSRYIETEKEQELSIAECNYISDKILRPYHFEAIGKEALVRPKARKLKRLSLNRR